MKAILEFNLPEDSYECKMAHNASAMHSVLWDLDQWLRSQVKHADLNKEQWDCYKDCRDKLYELLNENNIELS